MFPKAKQGYYDFDPDVRDFFVRALAGKYEGDKLELKLMQGLTRLWCYSGYKYCYPDTDIVSACLHTDILDTVEACHLRDIFPSFCFIFPRSQNLVQQCYVAYVKDYMLLWMVMRKDEAVFLKFNREKSEGTISNNLNNSTYMEQDSPDATPKITEIKQDVREAVELCMNLLLIMQEYPNYVTEKPGKLKPKGHDVIKNTNLYVSEMEFKRQIKKSNSNTTDTQKHCRSHWRRGHWRHQHYGPRTEDQVRFIWIKPYFVHGAL